MRTSPLLDGYKGIVGASQIEQIYEVARSLAGLRVLHVNTTARSGGVAEILRELTRDCDCLVRWDDHVVMYS